MKRIYRGRALAGLYAELQSKDFDRREYALFQMALLLRRSSERNDDSVAARDAARDLPRELLRIRLTPADKEEMVAQLSGLIAAFDESRATAFWVLGEVPADYGMKPTIDLVCVLGDQLSYEAAYQACAALRRWLPKNRDGHRQISARLESRDPRPHLRAWSSSRDLRLALEAKTLLDGIEALFTEAGPGFA